MAGTLGSIGSFFSGPTGKGIGTLAGLGATGAGLYGNISGDQQRADAAKQAQKNANLTPAQLAAQVSQATQPLNANLVQAITGNVNANMAEQGLSQAPGLQATAIAQALAGPEQQNQQTALNLVLQRLGLPAELLRSIPPNSNMSQLLALLMRQNNPGATPGVASTNSFGAPAGSYPTMPYPLEAAGAMPQGLLPSGNSPSATDWLGNAFGNQPYTPDAPPDVGGY